MESETKGQYTLGVISKSEQPKLTLEQHAIQKFEEYLVSNLAKNNWGTNIPNSTAKLCIYVHCRFGDKDLDLRPTSHIYFKDSDGREYLVVYNIDLIRVKKLERKIKAAIQHGIQPLNVLIKSLNENGAIHGDFFRFDRNLTKLERLIKDMFGQIYYFDSSKNRIEVFNFEYDSMSQSGVEPIDVFDSFRIVPYKPENLKAAKLEHITR
ncbi:hypothetical protein HYX18_02395 [Candidatus Woesearchaeota archaeon]|nr:hypothetical protein [Candidatus Woesearchaeota archaeon]